jgi:hypothetical protein
VTGVAGRSGEESHFLQVQFIKADLSISSEAMKQSPNRQEFI